MYVPAYTRDTIMYPTPPDVRRVAQRFSKRVQRDEIAFAHVHFLLTHHACEEMDPNVEESLHLWCRTLNVSLGYLCQTILDEITRLEVRCTQSGGCEDDHA